MAPRLLDLYCGAGGAAMGYHRAGFQVVGVDIMPQPHYPFEFIRYDAPTFLMELSADGWLALMQWDAVHASPPCKQYSALRTGWPGRQWDNLLGITRKLLADTGLPYVIENVPGSPISGTVMLCGGGILPVVRCDDGRLRQVRRHRYFETNWPLMGHPCHHIYPSLGVYGHGRWNSAERPGRRGAYQGNKREQAEGMGIDWMGREELREAIPPAYTEYMGKQLAAHLKVAAA